MPPKSKERTLSQTAVYKLGKHIFDDDDDDFQDAGRSLSLTQTSRIISSRPPKRPSSSSSSQQQRQPLKPSNSAIRPSKRPKASINAARNGKENLRLGPYFESPLSPSKSTAARSADSRVKTCCLITNEASKEEPRHGQGFKFDIDEASTNECHHDQEFNSEKCCSLDSMESTIDCSYRARDGGGRHSHETEMSEKRGLKLKGGYSSNSKESRLLTSMVDCCPNAFLSNDSFEDNSAEFEPGTRLQVLLKLCSEVEEQENISNGTGFHHHQGCHSDKGPIHCPLCGIDISDLTDELRQVHSNECLDKEQTQSVVLPSDDTSAQLFGQVLDGSPIRSPQKVVDVSPVLEWLCSLGLARYNEVFVREEIDWDSLQRLTDEDLFSIGVTALGPRKKIVHALNELRKEGAKALEINLDTSKAPNDTRKLAANKLITDYFPGSAVDRKKDCTNSIRQSDILKNHSDSGHKQVAGKSLVRNRKHRDIPLWCSIPGTPFRVDAFRYLRRDCSHWFLTHFHMDHYQGLTRSFCHGKVYCSLITARLVNLKIGIPWEKIQVLALNQKINIAGVDVTCFDANHCPGSIIILFEPPNGQAVLHTGDFRFSEEMTKMSLFQICRIQTLILDTTYCNPQYDFPKQEAVIQFVIEAIQAEAFNPKTLFLIGSYSIGKERLFLEVARVVRKKVYVTASKLRLLECLGLPKEDMQWFTLNEQESHIHVVPMWTLASFKRLKHISHQYASRFSLIVAFSPTGWTFGKGKKKSPGRRSQQGTIIRYEVPYSEHSSFTELREFVKFISPVNIIPSVNNDGPESANTMVSLLSSS
ncbi:hypothetical protein F0562_003061 [Nyssa sinensis]|uniref:SAM domain-containing protein n=1 Tax=Nyssa sinensis TaxID=561372 RepID=A0A5J5BVW4_9ASTE|nr:hypothetical protein F0562_003061 [Nyssa sinensis]